MFQVSVRQSHSHTECQLLQIHLKRRIHPHVESNFGSKKKSCYPTACATTVSCGFVFVRVWGCHFRLSYFSSNSFAHFPARLGIMDSSNGREIHYHLARAIVHLNCIAGFLPFFEPTASKSASSPHWSTSSYLCANPIFSCYSNPGVTWEHSVSYDHQSGTKPPSFVDPTRTQSAGDRPALESYPFSLYPSGIFQSDTFTD